jgi:hypothetical protein
VLARSGPICRRWFSLLTSSDITAIYAVVLRAKLGIDDGEGDYTSYNPAFPKPADKIYWNVCSDSQIGEFRWVTLRALAGRR